MWRQFSSGMVDMNNKLVQASIHQSKSILSTYNIESILTCFIFACMYSKTLENCNREQDYRQLDNTFVVCLFYRLWIWKDSVFCTKVSVIRAWSTMGVLFWGQMTSEVIIIYYAQWCVHIQIMLKELGIQNLTFQQKKCKRTSPRRGIEPRSPAWQAGILTTILTRMR